LNRDWYRQKCRREDVTFVMDVNEIALNLVPQNPTKFWKYRHSWDAVCNVWIAAFFTLGPFDSHDTNYSILSCLSLL